MSYVSQVESGTVKRVGKKLCHWCGERFAIGENYKRWSGVDDCGWWTVKFHEECYSAKDREEESEYSDFSEEIEEHERMRGMTRGETEDFFIGPKRASLSSKRNEVKAISFNRYENE
jgi:predicted  nucleic acid-binding Zn-ribbon protein